ncbi:putative quinol monooxygenase [Flavisphingomonas formosensis]|uniref:putative quinol monooxygenase n=1 Tax=Flavisphingomonas formosensis TaxID=861534 RepID=UPI0012F8C709|nr:antibiotic biosynthesis monooxygenase family protein [Sphingomonas formosensis]
MTDKVTVTLGLTLKPGAVDAFCASLPEAIKETATRPGFGSIRIVRDETRVLFIETWDSEAAYDAYIAWRTETGMMDMMAQILAEPPEKTVWPALVAAA